MIKPSIKLAVILTLTTLSIIGCSRPISTTPQTSTTPTTATPVADIPTSGLLDCDSDLRADMRYRPGDKITPRLHRKLSQFGCRATFEYKTRYLNSIWVDDNQEAVTLRCRTEVAFLFEEDFWLTNRDPEFKAYAASFLTDKFRGEVLQINLSGSRNVQCYATVQADFKRS